MVTESATPTHVDPDVLSQLRDVMEGDYAVLLETFLEDSHNRVVQLRKALDPNAVGQAAHSFKGSSSNMGALALASLCSRLEQCAKQPGDCDIPQLIQQIELEFDLVRPIYERERERFSA